MVAETQKYLCILMGFFYGFVQKGAVYLLTQEKVPCKLSQLTRPVQRGCARQSETLHVACVSSAKGLTTFPI